MKLFLVFLLVASCQTIELFDSSSYEETKEVELKKSIEATEDSFFKELVKAYPDVEPKVLHELAHQFALLIKAEIDFSLSLLGEGSKLASKLVNNMIKNLKKAEADGEDSIADSAKMFFDDMTRDMDELKEYNENNLYWESHFEVFSDVLLFKLEYGIWDQLNDTLHRIIGHLSGKFADLKDFFHKTIKKGAEHLRPHFINIKSLAKDLLANIGLIHRNVAQQAIEFFKPFARQLGSLYTKILEKIHQRFHDLAHPDTY